MRIIYGIYGGFLSLLILLLGIMTIGGADPSDMEPTMGLTVIAIMFIIGFILGIIDYNRRQRKKEEEEERQAQRQTQQDETNELMRKYLEQKLKEEKENLQK